jgi:hypothetical protein
LALHEQIVVNGAGAFNDCSCLPMNVIAASPAALMLSSVGAIDPVLRLRESMKAAPQP